jgi:undecaprenyl-diphosphatase
VPLLQIAVLALVQGITEFLPISSWAHLILVSKVSGWPDHGLLMEAAVHVGTLFAVILYLRRDIAGMLVGLARAARRRKDAGARLAGQVAIGSIPVAAAGFAVEYVEPEGLRSIHVIAWTTIGFAGVLYATDRMGMTLRRIEHLTALDAAIIGLAQALALVPGTSRSGVTMSAARLLGMERPDAARFSLMLSIPASTGAGLLEGLKLYRSGSAELAVDALFAAVLAFASALIAIAAMMAWLRRASFTPFVVYRLILGAVLLAFAHGWGERLWTLFD